MVFDETVLYFTDSLSMFPSLLGRGHVGIVNNLTAKCAFSHSRVLRVKHTQVVFNGLLCKTRRTTDIE